MSGLSTVPDNINFAQEEAKVAYKWDKEKTFKKAVELSKDRPHFTLYDGPPFATGLPHYGHMLTSTIKDVVGRWAHQNGHYVERRFGWDTHGLPVEYEFDKTLGISGPQDVLRMGMDNYKRDLRSSLYKSKKEIMKQSRSLGCWINFEKNNKKFVTNFQESVWWAFSELHKKGLVYKGVRVMPFSPLCSTFPNLKAGGKYVKVVDPAVFVGFKLLENPNRQLVAWTTSPWTLPSNLALVVHPDMQYVVAKDKTTGIEYVVMEERLGELENDNLEVIEKLLGKQLKDLKYEPLFPYFAYMREERNAFRVLNDTFVTSDSGTGVVHQAPYFGEIDFQVCVNNGVIAKQQRMICPVDENGNFTAEVTDFNGMFVKDADKLIVKKLKEMGNLVKETEYEHRVPICRKTACRILNKAVPSWYIRVDCLVPKRGPPNDEKYWVPSFVKDKRFANWLRDARDWAVSRNRFGGTPINLWVSEDGQEVVCVGSIAELEELSGQKITDLRRESVDDITIPSRSGRGVLKRVSEVFDWRFDAGCIPYARNHYPFENRKVFEDNFPADFIVDDTREWLYSLLVLSTALFDKQPAINYICTGIIHASDGAKMSSNGKESKILDQATILNKYGADALRLYLINSPVVRGENLRFREKGFEDLLKDVFLPWFNAYRFFVQNVQAYEHETGNVFDMNAHVASENVMDRWIESFTNSLVAFVRKEMDAYRLYAVVKELKKFFYTLTVFYIRLNRKRVKGDNGLHEQHHALTALGRVLILMVKLMAPFTPFFCEYMWENLKKVDGAEEESVHFLMLPKPDEIVIDESAGRTINTMRDVINLVRLVRDREGIAVEYPLKEMVVINRDNQFLEDVKSLEPYILLELNVRKLTVSQDKHKYGITLKAEPNFKILGARLKGEQKKVADYLKNKITEAELEQFILNREITVLGHHLSSEEVAVSYANGGDQAHGYKTHSDAKTIVMIDTTEDESLVEEGLCREVTNRIQRLRKQAKLVSTDTAHVHLVVTPAGSQLDKVVAAKLKDIESATGTPVKLGAPSASAKTPTAESKSDIKDSSVQLWLFAEEDDFEGITVVNGSNKVRVHLKTEKRQLNGYADLLYHVRSAFDLWSGKVTLNYADGSRVHPTVDMNSLAGQTLQLAR